MREPTSSKLATARWLPVAALAMATAMATGCMSFDGLDEPVQLTTQVSDWRDQIIYQVMIDRFEDGDGGNNERVDLTAQARWHGGDWAGLEQRLDYLSGLGVTALWISPPYRNVETDAEVDGYHGYWPQDFTTPDPHFGDVKALRSLVAAAHDRGMLVLLDVVTNHVGQLFYYDINLNGHADEQVRGSGEGSDVVHINEYDPDFDPRGVQARTSLGEAGLAPIIFTHDPATRHLPPEPAALQNPAVYNRRGRTLDFDDPDQLLHGDFPGGLKDLNTARCDVKQTMVDVYARWVELSDADGFRIDTIKHVDHEFWRYFTQKVRQRLAAEGKHNFFMFGEAFDGREDLVGSYTTNVPEVGADLARENECVTDGRGITGDQLDGVFHFPQYFQVMRDVIKQGMSTDRVEQLWSRRPLYYGSTPTQQGTGLPPIKTLVNFIDNHDVSRFLYDGDEAGLRLALLLIMTEDGIPCVYYGTEQGFHGGNDPANREDMWRSGFDEAAPLYQWTRRLTGLRRALPALRHGDQTVVWSSDRSAGESDAGIVAFERSGGDAGGSYALVVINVHAEHESHTSYQGTVMVLSAPPGSVLVDVLSPSRTQYTVGSAGELDLLLPARGGALLVPQAEAAGL